MLSILQKAHEIWRALELILSRVGFIRKNVSCTIIIAFITRSHLLTYSSLCEYFVISVTSQTGCAFLSILHWKTECTKLFSVRFCCNLRNNYCCVTTQKKVQETGEYLQWLWFRRGVVAVVKYRVLSEPIKQLNCAQELPLILNRCIVAAVWISKNTRCSNCNCK